MQGPAPALTKCRTFFCAIFRTIIPIFGIAISTAGTAASYQPGGYNLFTIRDIAKPIEALANYIGAHYLPPFAIHNANHITDEQIAISQEAYVDHLRSVKHVQTSGLVTINK
ncbi:NAD(P)H-dependent oxidoreductase [Paenibacillus illinoisensis]|uniref:NAD(P)H-dependent oxidoreductase n=1 Tax=Paenibacillus illinoisensis TaxID=59845 RepID=UPI00301C656A